MSLTHCPLSKSHLLSVALEDYYQVGAFKGLIPRGQWYRFETRFEHNAERALQLLKSHGIYATFFVSGWIADRFPEIVRKVADHGHEIASKSYFHRPIGEMTPSELREDLARSREALEKASGTRVLGFRTGSRWFRPQDLWALDVLAEEGYAYDSSLCPAWRRFAREPYRRFIHLHQKGTKSLWEFPISSQRVLGFDIPFAGGNYFRQFPNWLVKRAVARWHRLQAVPFVMYFHVWELDPEQPKINAASWLTRMRHYRNLGKMAEILEDYFKTYRFSGFATHLGLVTRTEKDPCSERKSPASPPAGRNGWHPETIKDWTDEVAPANRPVTVVVPCFNEELVLPYLVNTLISVQAAFRSAYNMRLLFVDDGSEDATPALLAKLFGDWPNVTILHHERNRGVAAAILTGIRQADTEIVCSMDCDCTYDPHELANMIPLLTEEVDLVTGSPYHSRGLVRNVPAWRLALSKSASWLYRRVLRQKLATYTSCFRVYRRSAVINLKIKQMGYLGIAEMLGMLDLQGSKIVEYPTTLEVRMLGRSKMKTLRTIFGHLRLMARLLAYRLFQTKVRVEELAPVASATLPSSPELNPSSCERTLA